MSNRTGNGRPGQLTGILPDIEEETGALSCPICGNGIPEGKLLCENCGNEISFVPDFEPEVDDSIVAAMSGVADEIAAENAASGGFVRREDNADEGYYDFHIRFPKRALRTLLIVACAALLFIVAVISIPRIVSIRFFDSRSRASEEQEAQTADSDPPVQEQQTMLEATVSPAETGTESIAVQAPQIPVFDIPSGRYEGTLTVTISNLPEDRSIRCYYTTDGSAPDEMSERYLGPILLEEPGEKTVRAVAVSEDGTRSEEAVAVYTIDHARPAAPVILEDSGEYTQSTMIVVVSQEDYTITYTTDGSDPKADSAVYTTPIKMPMGNSVFRFRAFDASGNASDIVERSYHLAYARLVSEEQATASVIRVLKDQHVLIDEEGKVLGKNGYNSYVVTEVIDIEGAGEYYKIVESYTEDGVCGETGLLYAVNTNDGSVNRLGYDSSGNYTLFMLSGR